MPTQFDLGEEGPILLIISPTNKYSFLRHDLFKWTWQYKGGLGKLGDCSEVGKIKVSSQWHIEGFHPNWLALRKF